MRNSATKLGIAIKTARKNKNLTQLELSEILGITPRHLQAIENENKTPSYDLLSRMLTYLDIPADSILSSAENDLTIEQEQLLYLIKHKCNKPCFCCCSRNPCLSSVSRRTAISLSG